MNTNKKITVIIPSYNHALYIEQAINSCIEQDYEGFIEIIVVDDNSSDDTKTVLEKYKCIKTKNRELILFFKETNKGINDSIEIALKYSTGEFIQALASDDYLSKEKIRLQLDYLNSQSLDGVYSKVSLILPDGNINETFLDDFINSYKKGRTYEYICKQDFSAPLVQSGLFKKNLFDETVQLRKDFKSDDWAFSIYIHKKYKIGFLNKALAYYRIHDDNTYTKYFITFPMRIDVISRLVPDTFKAEAFANIFLSQSVYLLQDHNRNLGIRFLLSAVIFNPSIAIAILKKYLYKVKRRFKEKNHDSIS